MNPEPTTQRDRDERYYGLDLLRTIAILLVILWHVPKSFFPFDFKPALWAGVDLFFVLSGYLIGSQLLRPYTRGLQPSFGRFYLRRALRVLPAYLVVLLLYFLLPQFREQPNISPLWRFLTFTQNFGLDFAARGAFSHAWSLCVEEHFYLALPFIVYWLMRKPGFRKACVLTIFIVVLGMVLRGALWIHYIKPLRDAGDEGLSNLYFEKVYYPTYARLDGLLVGVLIAAVRLFRASWWNRITPHGNLLLGAGIFVLAIAFSICQEMFTLSAALLGFPLLAIGFGLLTAGSLCERSLLAGRRIFGATAGATLAYSIYLTHKEVMHLDRTYLGSFVSMNGVPGLIVYALTIVAAASVLHFCVERPFLKLRDRILGGALSQSLS